MDPESKSICQKLKPYLMNVTGNHLWIMIHPIQKHGIWRTEVLLNIHGHRSTFRGGGGGGPKISIKKIYIYNFFFFIQINILILPTLGTATKAKSLYTKHACGAHVHSAMYIDTRRISDDKPWHETDMIITKNTPV
jgi:hypothetical protein